MPQPIKPPVLTVRAISAVGVEVPMTYVLGTSRGRITKAPLLLIDVETDEGVTGRSYLWSYFPRAMVAIASILQEIEERTKGERVDPAALWAKLVRTLRADRRAGRRPHGDGGLRHRLLGRARDRGGRSRWCACSAASRGACWPTIPAGLG